MQVFTGDQARQIILSEKFPVNSIGISKVDGGYLYYYWDGYTFDSGLESTEKKAFQKAKMNLLCIR